jgi:type II secretory pathway pseudopilin PulG
VLWAERMQRFYSVSNEWQQERRQRFDNGLLSMKRGLSIIMPIVLVLGVFCGQARDASRRQRETLVKQKTTASYLRSIGSALETYRQANGQYPVASSGSVGRWSAFLQPNYIRELPLNDAWAHPLLCESTRINYTVWSTGSDGQRDTVWTGGSTKRPESDIVYSNHSFIQWPEGVSSTR